MRKISYSVTFSDLLDFGYNIDLMEFTVPTNVIESNDVLKTKIDLFIREKLCQIEKILISHRNYISLKFKDEFIQIVDPIL